MDAICGVYCAGTPTTTSTATTKLLHKMEIQALDNSGPGNGGGKACKFLLVYSRHHHHKPPSFMRIGNFDKIDSVVFLARGIPIPAGSMPEFPRERLKIALDAQGHEFPAKIPGNAPTRSTRFFCLQRFEAEQLGSEWDSRVSNETGRSFNAESYNRDIKPIANSRNRILHGFFR